MKQPPNNIYKAGDVVTFGGEKGVVFTTNSNNPTYPIQVLFARAKAVVGYTAEGVFHVASSPEWKPRLEFVSRPTPSLWSKLKQKFKKKPKEKEKEEHPTEEQMQEQRDLAARGAEKTK